MPSLGVFWSLISHWVYFYARVRYKGTSTPWRLLVQVIFPVLLIHVVAVKFPGLIELLYVCRLLSAWFTPYFLGGILLEKKIVGVLNGMINEKAEK